MVTHWQLAVDMGNTACKLGLFREHEQTAMVSILYTPEAPDTWPDWPISWPDAVQHDASNTLSIGICSVVPQRLNSVETWIKKHLPTLSTIEWCLYTRETLYQTFSTRIGPLDVSTYAAGQLGADRTMDALMAATRYPQERVVVIDGGTMTTINVIDETGHFRGGAIGAGQNPSRLGTLLPPIPTKPPQAVPGLTPQDNLALGFSPDGRPRDLVEVLLTLLQALNWPLSTIRLVITGGESATLAENAFKPLSCQCRELIVDPAFTLSGIVTCLEQSQMLTQKAPSPQM